MKTVLLSALSFAVVRFIPSVLVSLPLLYSLAQEGPLAMSDLFKSLWFFTYWSGLQAIGFLIPIWFSPVWRSLSLRRGIVIAGALGFVSPWVSQAVTSLTLDDILTFTQWAPWLSAPLLGGIPGVILGFVAPWIARRWQSWRPAVTPVPS